MQRRHSATVASAASSTPTTTRGLSSSSTTIVTENKYTRKVKRNLALLTTTFLVSFSCIAFVVLIRSREHRSLLSSSDRTGGSETATVRRQATVASVPQQGEKDKPRLQELEPNTGKSSSSNSILESANKDKVDETTGIQSSKVTKNLWEDSKILPQWLKDYLHWHQEQLVLINKNNDAWKSYRYLLARCLRRDYRCGGASDRLKFLPYALREAANSKRLLFLYWEKPCALEEFLVPPKVRKVTGFAHPSLSISLPDKHLTSLFSHYITHATIGRSELDLSRGVEEKSCFR